MVNKRSWLGILVMVLVFGMAVVGNLEAQTDSNLNGTWVIKTDVTTDANVRVQGEIELKMQDGNFEQSETAIANGETSRSFAKGTYTARNGTLTWRQTHIMYIGDSMFTVYLGFVSGRWYTVDEYATKLGATAAQKAAMQQQQFSYSIVSSSLVMTAVGQTQSIVYTKKPE